MRRLTEGRPLQKHLVISATGINFIDVAGAEFLAQEAKRRRAAGGGLYLIRVKPSVLEMLEGGGYIDDIGRDRIFTGKTVALATVIPALDADVCRSCTTRIFLECAQRPGAAQQA